MKQIVSSTIKQILADRMMTVFGAALLIGGIGYIVYVAFNLQPSDLQLAVRYTSFGETQFYREKWWYLLAFVGFGVLFLVAHLGMMAKLFAIGMKDLAYGFAALSLLVLLLAFFYTYSVLGIAYLN